MASTYTQNVHYDIGVDPRQAQPNYEPIKQAPSSQNNPEAQGQPFVHYDGTQATVTYTSIPITVIQMDDPNLPGRQDGQEGNTMNLTTEPKGPQPQWFYCTTCQKTQLSEVRYKIAAETWLFLILFIILAAFLFFFIICMPSCQKAVHYCPQCKRKVGKTKYLW